jgi:mRNA degradation ribonuclease J1/J2
VYLRDSDQLMAETRRQIEKIVAQSNGDLQQSMEHKLRDYFFEVTKRKPMIFVVVNRHN